MRGRRRAYVTDGGDTLGLLLRVLGLDEGGDDDGAGAEGETEDVEPEDVDGAGGILLTEEAEEVDDPTSKHVADTPDEETTSETNALDDGDGAEVAGSPDGTTEHGKEIKEDALTDHGDEETADPDT